MFDPGLGLLEIRAANIDDVAIERIAKKFCAGERSDEGHLGRRCDRLAGFRCRRSNRADKRKDLVFLDCFVGGFDGFFGLVAVINRLELELAAVDAAGAVGFLEGRKYTFAHALAERLCRPVERRDLPEQNFVFGYAVFRP